MRVVRTSSGRLAAQALQHAREQIGEHGEAGAWQRWQDDQVVWRLAEGPDGSPQSLFLAGHVVMTAEPDRRSPAALLAAQYVVGALLMVLTWHGRPPASPRSVAAPGWSPGSERNGGNGSGNGGGGGRGKGDDPLARALAALALACDQARSRPAVLRELRRLHHGLAQVRGALVQGEQAAARRARRARQAGLRAAYTPSASRAASA
ncbi:MAG: hypothetical protein GEU81_05495 [Nitriliruptorales bacterium]|nr:hypothetical protein [Nitriliruptorales bacterium]